LVRLQHQLLVADNEEEAGEEAGEDRCEQARRSSCGCGALVPLPSSRGCGALVPLPNQLSPLSVPLLHGCYVLLLLPSRLLVPLLNGFNVLVLLLAVGVVLSALLEVDAGQCRCLALQLSQVLCFEPDGKPERADRLRWSRANDALRCVSVHCDLAGGATPIASTYFSLNL
jgi:hypothetical protein